MLEIKFKQLLIIALQIQPLMQDICKTLPIYLGI